MTCELNSATAYVACPSTKLVAQSVINRTIFGHVDNVSELCYHTNHQALSTARFRRGSLLATADTCHQYYTPEAEF